MPQATGRRFPGVAAQNPADASTVAWLNVDRIRADDNSKSGVTVTGVPRSSTVIYGHTFNLLAEEGGPIPAGATLVKVDIEADYDMNVADSLVANQASAHLRATQSGTVYSGLQSTRTQNDNTNVANIIQTATTGGTVASPQTVLTRAQIATAAGFNISFSASLPTGSVNNLTVSLDYIAIYVEWVLFADREGGVASSGVAAATAKVQQTVAAAGAASSSLAAASPKTQQTQLPVGVASRGLASASQQTIVAQFVGAGAQAQGSSGALNQSMVLTVQEIGMGSLGRAGALESTVVGYGLSGTARTATGVPLADVRVDLHKTADGSRFASTVSDSGGAFSFTLNSLPTDYFLRFYKAGPPNRFATTDEDLRAAEQVIQTA